MYNELYDIYTAADGQQGPKKNTTTPTRCSSHTTRARTLLTRRQRRPRIVLSVPAIVRDAEGIVGQAGKAYFQATLI